MKNQRPLTFEIIVTGLLLMGIACAGCILTGTLWAPLIPNLPLQAAREPSPTTIPTPTVIPSSTFTPASQGEPLTPPTPTLIPLPVLDFGTARTVPLIPIPTATSSATASPIPAPTSTAYILFVPTWPIVNPTFTPWVGPTPTTSDSGGSGGGSGGSSSSSDESDDNDDADDNDDEVGPGPCCRVCKIGKACGNTCIDKALQCSEPTGCACNG